jgi:tetratricopeptide (TPR) repeat protein
LSGKEHPVIASLLDDLGHIYFAEGKYANAEPLCKRSLEIRERGLGEEHPAVALSLNNLAALYDSQGRYAEAEPLYNIGLLTAAHTSGHPGRHHIGTSARAKQLVALGL